MGFCFRRNETNIEFRPTKKELLPISNKKAGQASRDCTKKYSDKYVPKRKRRRIKD